MSGGPSQATFGTSGSSWIRRPIPCPVSSAQTLKPRLVTSASTAAPIAPTFAPAVAASRPRRSADCAARGEPPLAPTDSPTGTVRQASA